MVPCRFEEFRDGFILVLRFSVRLAKEVSRDLKLVTRSVVEKRDGVTESKCFAFIFFH
jgi:hypothetical protein